MKVTSHLKIPTLLAASLSCLMLAGCGVDDKPNLPSTHSTDNGKTDSNDGGKTDGGKTDDGSTEANPEVLVTIFTANINTPIYEDGTDKEECFGEGGFGKNEGQKCGALTYAISADLGPITKVPEDKPVIVTYTLSSPQGDIADILQDPAQKTGTVKLHRGYIQSNLVIPLKTDNKDTGNWQVTLTLSNPENGAMFRDNAKTVSSFPREVIDPQAGEGTGDTKVMAKVNDTGVVFTGDNLKGNETGCSSDATSGQDCAIGRDAMYNDNSNGWAGFDFTKLDKDGKDLAADATDWSCVRDNVTGLVWERKTYAPTIEGKYGAEGNANKDYRDARWNYKYYDSTTGLGSTEKHPNGAGDTDCKLGDDVKCNTENYIAKMNEDKLCGISNWRVPNRNELFGIANLNSKKDDVTMQADWFFSDKDQIPNSYWTSSVAGKKDYYDGYRSPQTFQFKRVWVMYSTGQFDRNKPADGYDYSAIIAVSGPQQ